MDGVAVCHQHFVQRPRKITVNNSDLASTTQQQSSNHTNVRCTKKKNFPPKSDYIKKQKPKPSVNYQCQGH
jgi:hypothetical protein